MKRVEEIVKAGIPVKISLYNYFTWICSDEFLEGFMWFYAIKNIHEAGIIMTRISDEDLNLYLKAKYNEWISVSDRGCWIYRQ